MKQIFKSPLLLHVIESFFTTWTLMKVSRMEPGNIFTGVFFLVIFFLYRHIHNRLDKMTFLQTGTAKRTALLLSFAFTSFYMIVDYANYIEGLTNRLFQLIILTSVFLGFMVLFYRLLLFLFSYTGNKETLTKYLYDTEDDVSGLSPAAQGRTGKNNSASYQAVFQNVLSRIQTFFCGHTALCSFLLCIICWFPYFLYQYPGIMTPDSINQFEQALGLLPYSNHHPVAHTLLIQFFYRLGMLFTDNQVFALSLYTFFQMCAMAFAVSFFIRTLRMFHIRPLICFLASLFYALVPYHAVFAVTLWKDILFAASLLIFSCCLLRFSRQITAADLLFFVISGIMLCLFRSNGWYGFLLCFPFLLFYFRRKAKALFPALFVILLTAVIVKYPVMNAAKVIQPDFVESLSIPTQQIAAVICNDRPLTEEQLTLIENVVDLTYIKELYVPTFADNMKELIRAGNPDYLEAHKKDFFHLWLTLFMQYPGDYLEAYVKQTYGYFYPDSFYLVAEAEGISGTHLGVSHTPLIGGPLVVKAKEISIKLGSMLPLYSLLWSMGVIFWIFLFCIGNAFVRKEKAKLIYYLPSLALYLTVMIATPVATEFRYVYFMIFSLPFYLLCALLTQE